MGFLLNPHPLSAILVFYLTLLLPLVSISLQLLQALFYLRNIADLHSSLNLADAETVVHELITSRLD